MLRWMVLLTSANSQTLNKFQSIRAIDKNRKATVKEGAYPTQKLS